MTTIAYKDGLLAADSLITRDGIRAGFVQKIAQPDALPAQPPENHIVAGAAAGPAVAAAWFLDKIRAAAGPSADVDWRYTGRDAEQQQAQGFVVDAIGRIYVWMSMERVEEIQAPYIAIGSGQDFAYGAMHAGASAIEAVKAAIAHDVWSGGPIEVCYSRRRPLK